MGVEPLPAHNPRIGRLGSFRVILVAGMPMLKPRFGSFVLVWANPIRHCMIIYK